MKYIDLGLFVKWADCNFGAEFPEVFGLYQNWHEAIERAYPEGQLPTKEQFEELTEKCKWKVSSLKNYQSIHTDLHEDGSTR